MENERTPRLRRCLPSLRSLFFGSVVLLPLIAGPAFADDTGAVTQEDLKLLQKELEAQKQALEQQKQALQQQQQLISNQQNQLNFLKSQVGASDDPDTTPVTFNLGTGTFTTTGSGATKTQDTTDQPVGEAPEESDEGETKLATVLADESGVLSERGELVVEPSLRFTHSTSNRAFATGVEIQDIVFIGLIEVDEADRNTVEAAMTARYGVTDRFEVETRVPFVYREEDVTQSFVTQTNQPQFDDTNTGTNIGDVEVAAHYQITDAPIYTVANVRLYTPTGTGPFDVDVDALGRPTELATGSGFWGIQPSLTAIFPTDPVVFFGTFGYTINIPDDIDDSFTITPPQAGGLPIVSTVGEVDPGDSINIALGMGLSLNEKFSFSLGFKYDYIFPTTEEVSVVDNNNPLNNFTDTVETDPLHAASFLAGWAYQINETVGVNLNFEVGATDDANDFSVRLGVPFRFKNLFGRE